MNINSWIVAFTVTLLFSSPAIGQEVPWSPLKRGSDNMEVLGHLPLGARLSVADMDVEQELHRPYAHDGSPAPYRHQAACRTPLSSLGPPQVSFRLRLLGQQ